MSSQPAGAAGTARGGTELVTLAAQFLACLVEQLCGEGTAAHAGAVGLEDAVDISDGGGGHSKTETCAGADGGRGCHEGIGAEVHVEHRALGSFGENTVSVAETSVDIVFSVYQVEGTEVFGSLHPFLYVGVGVVGVVKLFEEGDMLLFQGLEAVLKVRGEDISYTESVPAGLVHVCGTDSLEGRAYLGFALGSLGGRVYDAVGGGDEVGLLRYADALPYGYAQLLQILALLPEYDRVEDYAASDEVVGAFPENARGYGVQYETLPSVLDRVSGVRAALEAGDDIVFLCKDIHYLALALVSPLEAEYDVYFCCICVHDIF